jgi:hypothetical protein
MSSLRHNVVRQDHSPDDGTIAMGWATYTRAEAGRIRRDHKAETAQGRDGSWKTGDEIVDM